MQIPADLVVMAAGIRPNYALAEKSGIYCNRGIVENDTMQTYDPKGLRRRRMRQPPRHRLRPGRPLFEQAGSRQPPGRLRHRPLHRLGDLDQAQGHRHRPVLGRRLHGRRRHRGNRPQRPARRRYKKLVIKDNKLVGGVMYGDTADGPWYFQLLKDGAISTRSATTLIFGQSLVGDVGHAGNSKAPKWPTAPRSAAATGDQGHHRQGDQGKGPVLRSTRSRSTPRRRPPAAPAPAWSSRSWPPPSAAPTPRRRSTTKPVCGCTDHSHKKVREAIVAQHLTSKEAVFAVHGMEDARTAAQVPPGHQLLPDLESGRTRRRDDPQSRFINERAHANIQKDGTYRSPRMGA